MAYLYILLLADKTHYCGITKNLVSRMQQHTQGMSKSTRHKLPIILKYVNRFETIQLARVKEIRIKKQGVTRWYTKNKHTSLEI